MTIETTKTVKLAVPIMLNGQQTSQLTFRRPRAGDVRAMDRVQGSQMAKNLYLIGALAEPPLSPDEVDQIDALDLQEISEMVEGFTKRQAR